MSFRINNVSSIDGVQAIRELLDLYTKFTTKSSEYPTIILLARNCLATQMKELTRPGCSNPVIFKKKQFKNHFQKDPFQKDKLQKDLYHIDQLQRYPFQKVQFKKEACQQDSF